MILYSALFVSGYVASFISLFRETKNLTKLLFCLFLVSMFVLSGFRSLNVGYDNIGHFNYFSWIADGRLLFFEFKEPGFGFFSLIMSLIGGYNLFLVAYSFVLLMLLVVVIRYFSINPLFSLYIYLSMYFLGNNMGKIRQAMAVLFVLIALIFLFKRENKLFLLFVFIGASFQATVLFSLLLLPLSYVKLTKNRMVVIALIAILIGLVDAPRYVLDAVLDSGWIERFSFLGISRITFYAETDAFVRSSGGYLGFSYKSFLLLLTVFFYNKIARIDSEGKALFLFGVQFWGLVFFFMMCNLSLLNSRATMAFLMVEMLVVPYIVKAISSKSIRLAFVTLYLLAVFLIGYTNFIEIADYFVPFEFFF